MKCERCEKDLSDVVKLLGDAQLVGTLHTLAHVREDNELLRAALREVLMVVDNCGLGRPRKIGAESPYEPTTEGWKVSKAHGVLAMTGG